MSDDMFELAALPPDCAAAVTRVQQGEDVSGAVDVLEAAWEADRGNARLAQALVWALCEMVESGIHIDSIEQDVARVEAVWAALAENEQVAALAGRLATLRARAARLAEQRAALEATDDAALRAKQAGDLGYAAADPAKAARYFEMAASRLDEAAPQSAWYRMNAAMSFARAKDWEAAVPRLNAVMIHALQIGFGADNELHFCDAGIELVLHTALFERPEKVRAVWQAVVERHHALTEGAPDAKPLVWISTPSHFDLIAALMAIDCNDVLRDLLAAMRMSNNHPPKGARKELVASAEARVTGNDSA